MEPPASPLLIRCFLLSMVPGHLPDTQPSDPCSNPLSQMCSTTAEIDELRQATVELWTQKAKALTNLRRGYVQRCPEVVRPLAGKLHLPSIECVLEATCQPDPDLLRCLMFGLRYTGTFHRVV